MFSHRLRWDAHPNPITRLLAERRAAGVQILDLTVSNPTRVGLSYPPDLLAGLAQEQALRYDPDPRGAQSAREAVSRYYAQRGANIPIERILLTASTSEAYAYLFKLLADPGDEVLVPRPSYPLFDFLAALESVHVRQYPLRYDGEWHIDFSALESALSARTRAIVVVNPNNPTGSYLKHDELELLETLCLERDIAILSDEVFGDYAHTNNPRRVPTLAGDRRALTFSMSGLSKIAGLPQLKLGWIVASGPLREEAAERLEWIADTYLSVSTPVQLALPALLEVNHEIRHRTWENLATLRAMLASTRFSVLNAEGGWSAVIQAPQTWSEEEWTLRLLKEQNVLVQPGFFYDFESEAFLVVSLLPKSSDFQEGVRRLLAIL